MGMNFSGLHEVRAKLQNFKPKLQAALTLDSQNIANSMEAWAKSTANWTDRTGHARQFLRATVKWESSDKLMITLSHNVDYGIYLELCNAGRYAILEKSIAQYAPQFMDSWKQIVSSVGGLI